MKRKLDRKDSASVSDMKTHNLRGCPNSATHRWVEFRSKAQQELPQ